MDVAGITEIADKRRCTPRHVCADDWGGCLETDCPPGASMLRRIGLIPALPLCPLEETLDARQNRARQFVQIGGKIDYTPEIHRSEERTSELQSLMRPSYAAFCMKKQQNTNK